MTDAEIKQLYQQGKALKYEYIGEDISVLKSDHSIEADGAIIADAFITKSFVAEPSAESSIPKILNICLTCIF